ncbi:hypothetical protein QR98_0009280, partial [Sarcoptes scabiei]
FITEEVVDAKTGKKIIVKKPKKPEESNYSEYEVSQIFYSLCFPSSLRFDPDPLPKLTHATVNPRNNIRECDKFTHNFAHDDMVYEHLVTEETKQELITDVITDIETGKKKIVKKKKPKQ